jgi:hypothetical protein
MDGDANRRAHARIHLALGQETRREDFVIAMDKEGVVQPADAGMWVNHIRDYLQNDLRNKILYIPDVNTIFYSLSHPPLRGPRR